MENNYDFNTQKIELPNSMVVLVLGIISIIGCCCSYGAVGVICGIIALVLANSATKLYVSDPGRFTESSYKNMNAGKICAIIGIVISSVTLIFMLWFISKVGFDTLSDPTLIQERLQELFPNS